MCIREIFPFSNLDNKKFMASLDCSKTQNVKKKTKNLELNELQENQPKLNFANHKSDKSDFYSSIDENTNLDINSKYYDTQDFNEMINTLSPEKKFSLLHTNISSLTENGKKLEYTLENLNLKFDIIAVTETWECETNKHMFTPMTLMDYKEYEGQPGSTRKRGCGLYIRNDLDYIPRTDLDYIPRTDLDYIPRTDLDYIPRTELDYIPRTDLDYIPRTDLDYIPRTDLDYISRTDLDYIPRTDLDYIPRTDLDYIPRTDLDYIPRTDLDYIPRTDLDYIPRTDLDYIPRTDLDYIPRTDLDYMPRTDLDYIPRTDLDYIPRTDLDYIPRTDTKFKNGNAEFEMKWIELIEEQKCNKIIGVIYRHPNNKYIDFNLALSKILQNVSKKIHKL